VKVFCLEMISRCSTQVGSTFSRKYQTRVEVTDNDKKTRGLYYKTFYGRNLRIFVIS
jgi:hypothetical protein